MILSRAQLSNVWILACAALSLSACDYQTNKDIGQSVAPIDTSALSFEVVYARIIHPSCVTCHGSDGGVNLETYENVVAHLDRIRVRAVVQGDMPKTPVPPLSPSDRSLLEAWIDAGAPLEPLAPKPSPSPTASPSPQPSPEPSWQPIVSTFDGVKTAIFGQKCSICHNPDGETDFDTEADLIAQQLILPGDPLDSDLYLRVTSPISDPDHMPPGEQLDPDEMEAIHAWILHIPPAPTPSPSPTPSSTPSGTPQ